MEADRGRPIALILACAGCVLFGSACAVLGVREQREAIAQLARIRGSVRVEPPSDSPIVVVLLRPVDPSGPPSIIDHYELERAGSFVFVVTPGAFRLAAFADENANLVYDPGEPALVRQPVFELAVGATLDHLDLVIPHASTLEQTFDIRALQARTPEDQRNFSVGRFAVRGKVVDLADPKFGPANGEKGMWRFADFLFEVGPGVYFLEKYDPEKVPVLFVHGIAGYPQQFAALIASLDRERFQPWFYFYPSGIHLDGVANLLTAIVADLQERLGFDAMAVVAHSMGGLVARAFVLKHFEQTGRHDIRLFVAISTPWGGSEGAANIERAPQNLVVYSWLDMDPSSTFLKGLFHWPPDYQRPRPLPRSTAFHMLLGYKRKEVSFGPSGDGVLSMKSEARLDAIEAAQSVLPLDYDHVGILQSAEAAERLNALLAQTFGSGSGWLGVR